MKVSDLCTRQVYLVKPGQPLVDAAREMWKRHIGALVVVGDAAMPQRPVGIVTDRDVVCGQLLRKADLYCLTVADVMTQDPLTLPEQSDVSEAIEALRARGVRRAPVVSSAGDLVGIVTIDDLARALAEELMSFAKLIGTQARRERGA